MRIKLVVFYKAFRTGPRTFVILNICFDDDDDVHVSTHKVDLRTNGFSIYVLLLT